MTAIKIDKSFLAMVMEDHNGLASYFLDREAGEIEMLAEDGYLDDNEGFEEMLKENPDRFLAVETMPSSEAFGIMEDFVDSLPDGEEKRILEKALSWENRSEISRTPLRKWARSEMNGSRFTTKG